MESLLPELVYKIAFSLPVRDTYSISLVNRDFTRAFASESVWETYLRQLGFTSKHADDTWKKTYQNVKTILPHLVYYKGDCVFLVYLTKLSDLESLLVHYPTISGLMLTFCEKPIFVQAIKQARLETVFMRDYIKEAAQAFHITSSIVLLSKPLPELPAANKFAHYLSIYQTEKCSTESKFPIYLNENKILDARQENNSPKALSSFSLLELRELATFLQIPTPEKDQTKLTERIKEHLIHIKHQF